MTMTNPLFFIPSFSFKNTVLIDLFNNINLFISNLNNWIVNLDLIFRPFLDDSFIFITVIGIVFSVLIVRRGNIILMVGKVGKEILQVAANVATIGLAWLVTYDIMTWSYSNNIEKIRNKIKKIIQMIIKMIIQIKILIQTLLHKFYLVKEKASVSYSIYVPFILSKLDIQLSENDSDLIHFSYSILLLSLVALFCFINIIGYIIVYIIIQRSDFLAKIQIKYPRLSNYITYYKKSNLIFAGIEVFTCFLCLLMILGICLLILYNKIFV